MSDVRYYMITINGRIQMDATTDEDAMIELQAHQARGYAKPKRIMKETRETVWETEHASHRPR
jgi:hypothetical protein